MAFSIGMLLVCFPFSDPSPMIHFASGFIRTCFRRIESGTPVHRLQLVKPQVSCAVAFGPTRYLPVGLAGAPLALHSRKWARVTEGNLFKSSMEKIKGLSTKP